MMRNVMNHLNLQVTHLSFESLRALEERVIGAVIILGMAVVIVFIATL